jgi:glycosyltransferase involved in cell wall biosynthesis
MIVKDEARTLESTLTSVKPYIDRWCILDTGSSDDTPRVVRDAMAGVPGALHEEPFLDFAATRNRGLDLCGLDSDFILWLDADDVLQGGGELRSFLAGVRDARGPDREAYYVPVRVPGATFDSARVVASRAGWRFRGSVHEVLMHPDRGPPSHRIPGVTIAHHADGQGAARSKARWERDVRLLESELTQDPRATRPAFYLGMTLLWLGRYEPAIAALDRRIDLGGWSEEVFFAKLSKARAALHTTRPWAEVLAMYLDAHAAAPHRAEPLCDVAARYDREGNHALALLFARRAYELPLPTADSLFVEEDVYAWRAADLVGTHAYWLGEYELGEQAASKAVAAKPGETRLVQNLAFYEKRRRP